MKWQAFKYAMPLLLFGAAWHSFHATGISVWLPVFLTFLLLPLIELFQRPLAGDRPAGEPTPVNNDRIYDLLLYLIVPLQYITLYQFLSHIGDESLATIDKIGRTLVMGLVCGIFGINVGHELGHRKPVYERIMARALLLTSLYMHFYIEHNRGHHKHVGTPSDPATAPYGCSVYRFWLRSIPGVFRKAWDLAALAQSRQRHSLLQNEMLQYLLIELGFCLLLGLLFGWQALLYFLAAALIGILLLETVNYIEHYGLMRKEIAPGRYERAQPEHSWNSDHLIGRAMLFELSLHSDHHYLASRKYQMLKNHPQAPQLPTGYPGSMLLALLPPAWFLVMHKRIRCYREQGTIR